MSTDLQAAAADPASREEVDVDDPAVLQKCSQTLGLIDEALLAAVQAVGPRVDLIKDYLGSGGMAGDQEDA